MSDREIKPKFKIGDKVINGSMRGKVVKIEYDEHLGYCYLIKYSIFKKLWTMGLNLSLGW